MKTRTLIPVVAVLFAVLILVANHVHAQFGGAQSGDWFYEVMPDWSVDVDPSVTREARIVGYIGNGGDVIIPSQLDGYPVVYVGIGIRGEVSVGMPIFMDGFFEPNTSVVSVVIPDSVRIIESGAFNDCKGLTSVTIGNSTTTIGSGAFGACSNLTQVTFGRSVRLIMDGAFGLCGSLDNVILPDSVEIIGDGAFGSCTSLATIQLSSSLRTIGQLAFWGAGLTTIEVPDSVTSIGLYAFAFNFNLTYARLSDNLLNVPDYLFRGCTGLQKVTLPNQAIRIGMYAFYGCSALTMVEYGWRPGWLSLPSSIISLGDSVFAGCSSLPSLALPEGLTAIPPNAFSACNSLRHIGLYDSAKRSAGDVLPKSISSIGDYAFIGTLLTKVNVPLTTYISPVAFSPTASIKRDSNPSTASVGVSVITDTETVLSKEDFLSALSTNPVFVSALAQGIVSSTNGNYGLATKSDLQSIASEASLQTIAQIQSDPNSFNLYSEDQYTDNFTNGVASGISTVISNPSNYNLYTSDSIMDLRMGGAVMQKQGGTAKVVFQPQTTMDLVAQPFTNNGPAITNEIPMPGDKGFLRIQAKPQ
jgi:hypothetical protein